MKFSVVLITLLISTLSLASDTEFNPANLLKASENSLSGFLGANPDQEEAVTGFKSWKAGVDAKVRIYLTHVGGHTMEVNYFCSKEIDVNHITTVSCQED